VRFLGIVVSSVILTGCAAVSKVDSDGIYRFKSQGIEVWALCSISPSAIPTDLSTLRPAPVTGWPAGSMPYNFSTSRQG
jgi:hypothetical protein